MDKDSNRLGLNPQPIAMIPGGFVTFLQAHISLCRRYFIASLYFIRVPLRTPALSNRMIETLLIPANTAVIDEESIY